MKKVISMAAAAVMALSLAACSSSSSTAASKASSASSAKESASAEATESAVPTEATYTITNKTGENVKELYIIKNGSSDKGENYAEGGLADGDKKEVTLTDLKEDDAPFTLEYVTDSGRDAKFETLNIETVSINLLAEDAMTGSTPIEFTE